MLTESLLSSEVPLINNYNSLETHPYPIVNKNNQMSANKENEATNLQLTSEPDVIQKQDTGNTHMIMNPCTNKHF